MSTLQQLHLDHIFTLKIHVSTCTSISLILSRYIFLCCLLPSHEGVLGWPSSKNRRVKMYNSNPLTGSISSSVSPGSLFQGYEGGSGLVWSSSQCTHRLCPYCARLALMFRTLSSVLWLSFTLRHPWLLKKKRKFIQVKREKENAPLEYDSCMQVALWFVLELAASPTDTLTLSTTRSTLGLFQPTIMGNVFPASKLSRSSAQCILMCRYVS